MRLYWLLSPALNDRFLLASILTAPTMDTTHQSKDGAAIPSPATRHLQPLLYHPLGESTTGPSLRLWAMADAQLATAAFISLYGYYTCIIPTPSVESIKRHS